MKKNLLIGLGIGIVVVSAILIFVMVFNGGISNTNAAADNTALQSSERSQVMGGAPSYNIVLNISSQNTDPDTILVYKTVNPGYTKEDAIAFAKKFNVTDIGILGEGDTKFGIRSKDGQYELDLFKNGGQRFTDTERSDSPNGIDIAANLPSDADAKIIAEKFLKERDLLPPDAEFGHLQHRQAFIVSNHPPTVSWEDILIYYHRHLNGLKVIGTQYEIEVGAHGDIIAYFTNWKGYSPAGEYKVKPLKTAFEELQQKGVSVGMDKPDTVSIDSAYLAYHTEALAFPEDYLEPVWVFEGEALVNGTAIQSVEEYIPALTEKPAGLTS
jgi:hypothetical protein